MFESKRLIGFKYSNPHVQKDIKLMKPLKIIEEPKTKKSKYVMENKNNKNIKRAVITVLAILLIYKDKQQ